jgi:hypothetical protein
VRKIWFVDVTTHTVSATTHIPNPDKIIIYGKFPRVFHHQKSSNHRDQRTRMSMIPLESTRILMELLSFSGHQDHCTWILLIWNFSLMDPRVRVVCGMKGGLIWPGVTVSKNVCARLVHHISRHFHGHLRSQRT